MHPGQADSRGRMKAPAQAEQSSRSANAIERLVVWTTPWLVEVGSWVFGGLIALNLVVIAALITVGPVDRAVLIGVVAFACALPLDIAGIVLLRLVKDARDIHIDDLGLKAFQEAQFPDIEAYFPPVGDRESSTKRREWLALAYALSIATLSMALTLVGLVASLWHLAPWIAVSFVVAATISILLIVVVAVHSLPPPSEAEHPIRRSHRARGPRKEAT
jgi:hypothetical protein